MYLLHSSLVIIFESFDCGAVHIDELASSFHRTHEERPRALRVSDWKLSSFGNDLVHFQDSWGGGGGGGGGEAEP